MGSTNSHELYHGLGVADISIDIGTLFTRHHCHWYTNTRRTSTFIIFLLFLDTTSLHDEDYQNNYDDDIAISDQWTFGIMGDSIGIPTWLADTCIRTNSTTSIEYNHNDNIAIHDLSLLVMVVW